MDFELSEEQRAFQATARTFAREQMMPNARAWDEGEIFPVDALRKAAALGFGGIYVKEDVGGSALSRLDAALIFAMSGGNPATLDILAERDVEGNFDNRVTSILRRYLSGRGGFYTNPFTVSRFVLLSSRDSVGGGPYVTEEVFPLYDNRSSLPMSDEHPSDSRW